MSQEGGTAVAPEQDEPSLDAVERLLSERSEEFREKLRVYNNEVGFEPLADESGWAFKLWEIQVLGIENGAYKVRAVIEAKGRGGLNVLVGAVEVIVLLKVEGNDFEIVGHEFPPAL